MTPNTFKELEEDPEDPAKTRTARSKKKLYLQTAAYMSILWEATYRGKFLYGYSYKIG